jgi:hypothetical protein
VGLLTGEVGLGAGAEGMDLQDLKKKYNFDKNCGYLEKQIHCLIIWNQKQTFPVM